MWTLPGDQSRFVRFEAALARPLRLIGYWNAKGDTKKRQAEFFKWGHGASYPRLFAYKSLSLRRFFFASGCGVSPAAIADENFNPATLAATAQPIRQSQ